MKLFNQYDVKFQTITFYSERSYQINTLKYGRHFFFGSNFGVDF